MPPPGPFLGGPRGPPPPGYPPPIHVRGPPPPGPGGLPLTPDEFYREKERLIAEKMNIVRYAQFCS